MAENNIDNYGVEKGGEYQEYEDQLHELQQKYAELLQLQQRVQELENVVLNSKITRHNSLYESNSHGSDITPKTYGRNTKSDRHLVLEFIQSQEVPVVKPKLVVTPNHTNINNIDSSGGLNSSEYVIISSEGLMCNYTTGVVDIESSTNDNTIGYGRALRKTLGKLLSVFQTSNRKSLDNRQSSLPDNGNEKSPKQLDPMLWSIDCMSIVKQDNTGQHQDSVMTAGLQELAKYMRDSNGLKVTLMHKILVRQWSQQSPHASRIQFLYHTLKVLVTNGCLVTICTDHRPPCRSRVCTRLFESTAAPVLKSFLNTINGHNWLVIGVEVLVALELLVYAQPIYRTAIGDLFDILYRKGGIEAIAFSQWSQTNTGRPTDKQQLINEIKEIGFNLFKLSSLF